MLARLCYPVLVIGWTLHDPRYQDSERRRRRQLPRKPLAANSAYSIGRREDRKQIEILRKQPK